MKKIFTVLSIFITLIARSQDSVRVTLSVQTRDLEFIGRWIYNHNSVEDLYDSIKTKFRPPFNPPTGNTTISITGYTMDWIDVLKKLRNDPLALKLNHASRVDALLRAVGQPYLTGKIDALDAIDVADDNRAKTEGRFILKRGQ